MAGGATKGQDHSGAGFVRWPWCRKSGCTRPSEPISGWQRTETATAYDIDPLAVAAITLNAAANDVTVLAVGADILAEEVARAEVLLVADAFYERDLAVLEDSDVKRTTSWAPTRRLAAG